MRYQAQRSQATTHSSLLSSNVWHPSTLLIDVTVCQKTLTEVIWSPPLQILKLAINHQTPLKADYNFLIITGSRPRARNRTRHSHLHHHSYKWYQGHTAMSRMNKCPRKRRTRTWTLSSSLCNLLAQSKISSSALFADKRSVCDLFPRVYIGYRELHRERYSFL